MENAVLAQRIEEHFKSGNTDIAALADVETVIARLDEGTVTVVERRQNSDGESNWQVNAWVKKRSCCISHASIEKMEEGEFFTKCS